MNSINYILQIADSLIFAIAQSNKYSDLRNSFKICLAAMLFLLNSNVAISQKNAPQVPIDSTSYSALEYRCIGPWRGGRSAAVAGVPGKPNLFYFGSTGGGIWRTVDGGRSWGNISDGYFGGSIGAIAVAESDQNIIYVGGGEKTVRGNVSFGSGIYKTMDAGKTWTALGLKDSRHISRIRIHPTNPDLVYVAVMGDLYKNDNNRGLFRSRDGGKSFEKVLFVSAEAGIVDICIDPTNARVLYATSWKFRRTPYSFSSGGAGSGIWKSTDGGDKWVEITKNEGLPKDSLGIIGIAVSPAKQDRVWAIVEAKDGGVFRSDDGGLNWIKTNDNRELRQRAWYYSRIYADSKDEETVYVLNVGYHKSKDGGKTFKSAYAPHGDHHDLWIAPEDPKRIIIGDDGGAQITYDAGDTWTTYHNQPTAQLYRLTTDNHFPYRIYAAQQDNSAIRIAHRSSGSSISEKDWEDTAGGESAHIAVDPTNPEIVYGGSYGGYLTRMDHRTNTERAINVWPDNPMGSGADGMKYRFQWNFPIFFSVHDPKKLYACSNQLHVTQNEGQSWDIVSPDLTRNDSTKLRSSGGPITKDNTGVEYYCTIFAAAESPVKKGTIWTGSDDGLIHVTTDEGANWQKVTPPMMPEWCLVNCIDPDPFDEKGCYVAATSYKSGDYKPYLFKTNDLGRTWTLITNGIRTDNFTRVIRADKVRKGMLYCGTEAGMYISFDDGAHWQSFQQNLPIVPITDLLIKDNNLIVATQGRSIWLLDDLSLLQQISQEKTKMTLYKPKLTYRMRGGYYKSVKGAGINHPNGAMIYFTLNDSIAVKDTLTLSFLDKENKVVKTFSNFAEKDQPKLNVKKGNNLFIWTMRANEAKKFDGMVLWNGNPSGHSLMPGEYTCMLKWKKDSVSQKFMVAMDPRVKTSTADLQMRNDFLDKVLAKVSETNVTVGNIRDLKQQFGSIREKWEKNELAKPVIKKMETIDSCLSVIEKTLYQTQNKSGQDPLNFPIRLNDKLAGVYGLTAMSEDKPTDQAVKVADELIGQIDQQLKAYQKITENELKELNALIRSSQLDVLTPKK